MTGRRLVIVGATGMVGGHALRYALGHPAVGAVTSIGRRKTGISHAGVQEIIHPDFADCAPLAEVLRGQQAALFCLGAYTGSVPDAGALTGVVGDPAWKHKPSWYLVATDDRMIPPAAQRAMSARAGATAVEAPGSHAVYVSQPKAVAGLIAQAARDAGPASSLTNDHRNARQNAGQLSG